MTHIELQIFPEGHTTLYRMDGEKRLEPLGGRIILDQDLARRYADKQAEKTGEEVIVVDWAKYPEDQADAEDL